MRIRQATLKDLKDKWERLYERNPALTPYSSYEFNCMVCRYYRCGASRLFFHTKIFEILDQDDNTLMIIPLYGQGGRYYIIGDLLMTGYLDFIYGADAREEDFAQALALLQKELKGSRLCLNKVNQRSRLNDYLSPRYPAVEQPESTCVSIAFGSDYDAYFQSLSKNIRQNIRTRCNRLQRQDLPWEVDVKIDTSIDPKMKSEILGVYNERSFDKNQAQVGWLLRLTRHYLNPITISTMKMAGNFNSVLRIDGAIAAILCGYVNSDQSTVILPRIAMNSAYSQFSPGLLLITETIRWLIDNTGITNLDLSRGDEAYKFALGGKAHHNYAYVLDF